MRCPGCGAEISDVEAEFCSRCGSSLRTSEGEVTSRLEVGDSDDHGSSEQAKGSQ
ncbi:MAG: zinc-ribbon domain-containing protein, partial [Actinomycetota bacterium]